jgi:protein AroM
MAVLRWSREKVERDLQSVIEVMDNQGYDVILLMSTADMWAECA